MRMVQIGRVLGKFRGRSVPADPQLMARLSSAKGQPVIDSLQAFRDQTNTFQREVLMAVDKDGNRFVPKNTDINSGYARSGFIPSQSSDSYFKMNAALSDVEDGLRSIAFNLGSGKLLRTRQSIGKVLSAQRQLGRVVRESNDAAFRSLAKNPRVAALVHNHPVHTVLSLPDVTASFKYGLPVAATTADGIHYIQPGTRKLDPRMRALLFSQEIRRQQLFHQSPEGREVVRQIQQNPNNAIIHFSDIPLRDLEAVVNDSDGSLIGSLNGKTYREIIGNLNALPAFQAQQRRFLEQQLKLFAKVHPESRLEFIPAGA